MPITFLISPETISKSLHPLCNGGWDYKNIRFLKKTDCAKPSNLKLEIKPKSRFLKSVNALACKCCLSAKSCSSSSSIKFNIKDSGDYDKRVGLEQKKALIVGGSDTSIGGGDGGGPRNNGGGQTGGNDSGGLGENGGWEKVKWWSWWLFDTWKDYNYQLAHPGSASFMLTSRFVMSALQAIAGGGDQDLGALLMQLLLSMCVLTTVAISGFSAELERQLMLLFSTGVVGFVLIMSFLVWKLYLHYNL